VTSYQHEPTNEELWAQPPADRPAPAPSQAMAPYSPPAIPAVAQSAHTARPDRMSFVIAIISLGVAIPLTAIGLGMAGLPGLIIVWVGLVLLNAVFGASHRQH